MLVALCSSRLPKLLYSSSMHQQCLSGRHTWEASRKWRMDQTMGKSTAQQHTMSTRCRMSRHVIQFLLAGVASSKITMATSAQTCMHHAVLNLRAAEAGSVVARPDAYLWPLVCQPHLLRVHT